MDYTNQNFNTCVPQDYSQYCVYRMPCGICRFTNSMCPLKGGNIEITWQNPQVTCEVKNE